MMIVELLVKSFLVLSVSLNGVWLIYYFIYLRSILTEAVWQFTQDEFPEVIAGLQLPPWLNGDQNCYHYGHFLSSFQQGIRDYGRNWKLTFRRLKVILTIEMICVSSPALVLMFICFVVCLACYQSLLNFVRYLKSLI